MGFLDKLINKLCEKVERKVSLEFEDLRERSALLEKRVFGLEKKMSESIIDRNNFRDSLDFIRDSTHELTRKLDLETKGLNSRIDENYHILRRSIDDKESLMLTNIGSNYKILRQEIDDGLTGVTIHFDKRLEMLGDKKGIVIALLKKIAELEGNNV